VTSVVDDDDENCADDVRKFPLTLSVSWMITTPMEHSLGCDWLRVIYGTFDWLLTEHKLRALLHLNELLRGLHCYILLINLFIVAKVFN